MDGIRIFCDDGYDTCKRLIETARNAAVQSDKRIVVCCELRCKIKVCVKMLESKKMSVGAIQNDDTMALKIKDKLIITNDESVIGKPGIISVKNCHSFSD